jgi:hypothetical protein
MKESTRMMGRIQTRPHPWTSRGAAIRTGIAIAAACATLLAGCRSTGASGSASIRSLGPDPLLLEQDFEVGCYAQLESECSFWFASVPLDAITRITDEAAGAATPDAVFLHAQLVWEPEPGRTPLASTATNTVTRLVVLAGGEMGLYGGACFARPLDAIGDEEVTLSLRGGTLTLLAKTDGFRDLLSPVGLEGTLTARRSSDETAAWRRAASQFVTNALGRSMWVDGSPVDPTISVIRAAAAPGTWRLP